MKPRSWIGFRGSEEERFWSKVQVLDNGCWQWTAATSDGYGIFSLSREQSYQPNRLVKAHRYAYEYCIGPIPEGLEPDHTCRNPGCVNPWHLEPMTTAENTYRGSAVTSINAQKIFCKRGHNNWKHYVNKNGRAARECLTCRMLHSLARHNKTIIL